MVNNLWSVSLLLMEQIFVIISYQVLFDFANSLWVFILPLTLRECLLVVLYDTVIALALILIDGTVAHLLKAAYIYLLGLYACTNSNCFLPPVLGKATSIIFMSRHQSALNHSVNKEEA